MVQLTLLAAHADLQQAEAGHAPPLKRHRETLAAALTEFESNVSQQIRDSADLSAVVFDRSFTGTKL